jgi:hypothetical protein
MDEWTVLEKSFASMLLSTVSVDVSLPKPK